ncbi:hypothetical protein PWT90_03918 [Aphanocladium album]|nr:hypothetical protein PWT90_03918 [Aphanocladium album]
MYSTPRGVEYIWIDELCIDKTSTADLDDAVNGSRRRLCNSSVCFAYLHDLPAEVPLDDDTLWGRCRYWTRAWTLQELILAPRVKFFDRKWNYRGDKNSPALAALLSNITSIPRSVLLDSSTLSDIALAVRISWSAGREAAREEDTAYALVAITEATLPIRYGEGAERAFLRLQEELLRDTRDGSLLAWRSARDGEVRGLLARSPSEFGHFAPASAKELQRPWVFDGKVRFSSKGIELQSKVCKGPGCVLLSIGQKRQDLGTGNNIAICFREWNGVYLRVAPASRVSSSALRSWRTIDVARDVDDSYSLSLRSLFNSMPCRLEIAKRGGYDEPWHLGLTPHVVQDGQESQQGEDTEMKMDSDDVLLALTPQKSRTPSNHSSEASYIHVASLTGSWTGPHDHAQQIHNTAASIDDDMMGADEEGPFAGDSDPGSMTSNSASASVSESEWEEDDAASRSGYFTSARSAMEEDDDAEALATETRSTTTVAAEQEDGGRSSLKNLIMQQSIRDRVLSTAYERVREWIATVRYVTPPQDRLPPASRINTTSWFAEPESLARLDAAGATTREQTVTVFRPDGYFHLACPFYAADPERHRSCVLAGRDLQSVAAVLRHVREHHPWTAYCARCHRDFAIPEERDAHMMERRCVRLGYPAPQGDASRKGVSEEELRHLRKMDLRNRHEGEAARWRHIYWSLFPDLWVDEDEEAGHDDDDDDDCAPDNGGAGLAENACEPYLRSGNGLAVSLVHDFWTLRRKQCVAEALEACGHDLDELDDDEALMALYQVTLKELIGKIYHEYHLDGQTA